MSFWKRLSHIRKPTPSMASNYYKSCKELEECNRLIEQYWFTQEYEKCFFGHLKLAEQGYPLAECQIGYFYLEGYGVEKDLEKAFFWTKRAAEHGDWDAQYNLATFYEKGIATPINMEQAIYWYKKSAQQGQKDAIRRSKELNL